MLKKSVIIVVVLIAALLIYAAARPGTFRVERTANINAPPEKIFALINDLRGWDAWSPYEKKDPLMKRTYSGAAQGTGAVYAWEGNREVGAGSIEITESTSPSRVLLNLHMIKPFEAYNIVEFTLEPGGVSTQVTWSMRGAMPYFSKVLGLFMNMDRMVGRDFEAGLANLKTAAEKKGTDNGVSSPNRK
jgi:uncharacterized protein YndB with AHSA1/START domain